MECRNIQHTLIDFIEGNISEDIKVQIEEHLLICKTCRTEHKQVRELLEEIHLQEDQQPDEKLKVNFYSMLEEEKEKLGTEIIPFNSNHKSYNWNIYKYAATAIIILGIGFILGQNLQLNSKQNSEIAALRSKLYSMQQTATLTSLSQPTASQRLNAINIINDQVKSDEKTINLLINTFKTDDNTNVRMAAANALAKYSESEDIREVFIDVLETEKDPALQITLINLLTQMQEKKAMKAFKKILKDENSLPVVKQQVEEGLKVFI